MPVFDVDAYVQSLKTKYNIADDDLKDVSEIKAGFKRMDEFSRYQQEHKTAMATVQSKYAELVEFENQMREMERTLGPREEWSAALQQRMAAQNPDGSGRMTPSGMTQADVERIVTAALTKQEEQFAQRLETVGQGAAAFAEFQFDAHEHWKSEYGTPLPKEEFKKFYTENGHTDPRIALKLFEAPYKEKKIADEWQKKVEAADREGEIRGRSQAGVPGSLDGGGWMSNTSISVGAAASAAPVPPADGSGNGNGNGGGLSRAEMLARFNSGMEKQAQATGNFQAEPK